MITTTTVVFGILCMVLVATGLHLYMSTSLRHSLVSCFLQAMIVSVLFFMRDMEYMGVLILVSGAILCSVAYSFTMLIDEQKKVGAQGSRPKFKVLFSFLFAAIISASAAAAVWIASQSRTDSTGENHVTTQLGALLSHKYMTLFVPISVLTLISILSIGFLLRKEKAKGVVFNAK